MSSHATHPSAPTHPRQHRPVLRWAGVVIGVLLGSLALGELMGWPFLKEPLARQIEQRTGLSVQFDGQFRTRLILAPQLSAERVTVGATALVDVPHLLQAEGLVLEWRWVDLWRASHGRSLRIKSLQADTVDAHLVRLKNGAASWQLTPGPAPESDATTSALPAPPELDRLVLHAGQVDIRDAVHDLDLKVKIQQSTSASARLPWTADAKGHYHGATIDLQAQAAAELPLLLQNDGDPPLLPLQLSGQIGKTHLLFDGAVGALWAGQGVDGRLQISGPSLQATAAPLGVVLPATPPYRIVARVVRRGPTWSVVTDSATVGSSSLTASMQYQTDTQPPRLSGRLGGQRLALADLAPSVGADKAPRKSGRVLPDQPFDLPKLSRMDANILVDLRQINFGTPSLGPVKEVKAHLVLVNSQLRLSDLSAQVAGGQLDGQTEYEIKQDIPQWTAQLRFSKVDLDSWIRGLNKGADADRSAARSYMSGTLDASISLKGHGRSVAEILGKANGKLKAEVGDGQLSQLVTEAAGLDVAQSLGMLIGGDKPLRLNCALVMADIDDGMVMVRHAVLDNVDSTLRMQGGASFKTEELRLRLVSEPKDFSPLSLRSPVTVTGRFGDPVLGIEPQGLIARAAGAVALALVTPPAALLALIDTGNTDDPSPCTSVVTKR